MNIIGRNVNINRMQSIVGRVGGKSRLKNTIIDLIPVHSTYVEPFVGGGAVFFGREEPSEMEVVNDLDKDIYHIYGDMKAVGEQIVNKNFKPSRTKFWRMINQQTFKSKAERLYRNLYISLFSFKNNRASYVGDKEEKRNIEYGVKYKRTTFKDRLKNVEIRNEDWKQIIKEYDGKDTFFYLDPPYSMASDNNDYNHNDISIDELYETLKTIKGKFLLSYDFNKEIKTKFKGFKIRVVHTKYNAPFGAPIDKKEYLISNFKG